MAEFATVTSLVFAFSSFRKDYHDDEFDWHSFSRANAIKHKQFKQGSPPKVALKQVDEKKVDEKSTASRLS